MLFNSFSFLLFFPFVTLIYFFIPHRYRWVWLLLMSCLFYMAFIPVYILILFLTILIDYFAAIGIEGSTGKKKKLFLVISILSTCLVLFFFKYAFFFTTNLDLLLNLLHLHYPLDIIKFILPIGLSFHTFQSLSYVIEVYRGQQKPEKHLGIYSLYVMFYPQLVAGPIERPQNLLYQFREKHSFNATLASSGLKLMAWGLFKKVVISDRLAILVNHVYGTPHQFQGLTLVIATVFFSFQIYCDFSGYSDIARGAARVMGFRLMKNFRHPYFYSASVSEFWTRWHISLSTWFKDYIYIPLGGNKVSKAKVQRNLMVTFILSGIWHGANWTYIIWGGLNGFYLLFSLWTKALRDRIRLNTKPISAILTFLLITFSWIFFRAESINDAFHIVSHLFTNSLSPRLYLNTFFSDIQFEGFGKKAFLLCVIGIFILQVVSFIQNRIGRDDFTAYLPFSLRWGLYYLYIFIILFFGIFNQNAFIYFQF